MRHGKSIIVTDEETCLTPLIESKTVKKKTWEVYVRPTKCSSHKDFQNASQKNWRERPTKTFLTTIKKAQKAKMTRKIKCSAVRSARDEYMRQTGLKRSDFRDLEIHQLIREGVLLKTLYPKLAREIPDDAIWSRAFFNLKCNP